MKTSFGSEMFILSVLTYQLLDLQKTYSLFLEFGKILRKIGQDYLRPRSLDGE